ncbi:NeuD/PglB/VioB family sugar acetyltransferase [Lysinibacillus fusiformis]
MKKLWIIGAGGLGREVYSWAIQHPDYQKVWEIAGFIDDILYNQGYEENKIAKYISKDLLLESFETYKITDSDLFVVAIADADIRRKVFKELKNCSANIITFIHPTVTIGQNVQIGIGTIICPHAILTCDIVVGEGVIINIQACIGHDVEIDDYVTVSGGVHITGGCKIGSDVVFGTNSSLVPLTKVEDKAFLGANSLGVGKIKSNNTVLGVPARRIKIGE